MASKALVESMLQAHVPKMLILLCLLLLLVRNYVTYGFVGTGGTYSAAPAEAMEFRGASDTEKRRSRLVFRCWVCDCQSLKPSIYIM